MLRGLILKNRSYRRFMSNVVIDREKIFSFIDLARLSPASANRQAIKFMISNAEPMNDKVFRCLKWAAYLKDWDGPAEDERPSAYIVVLGDKEISQSFNTDAGIAMQSILLGAVESGFGGCIFGSVDRKLLQAELSIPEHFEILFVMALGKPNEKVVIEDASADGDIKYWRDESGIHHVPKRSLNELVIN